MQQRSLEYLITMKVNKNPIRTITRVNEKKSTAQNSNEQQKKMCTQPRVWGIDIYQRAMLVRGGVGTSTKKKKKNRNKKKENTQKSRIFVYTN